MKGINPVVTQVTNNMPFSPTKDQSTKLLVFSMLTSVESPNYFLQKNDSTRSTHHAYKLIG